MSFVKLFHIFWHKKWNITSRQCLYRYSWINLFCSRQGYHHGRPQEFFQRGAEPRGLTKMTKARTKIFAIFRRLRLNLRVFDASAEGASKILGYFARNQHMTSFSNSRGEQLRQIAPLLANGYHVQVFYLPSILFCCDDTNSMNCKYNIPTNQYTCNTRMRTPYFWCRFGVTISHVLFTCFPRFTWC